MIRTQIYIPDVLHQTAKNLAAQRNESLAELLRKFISQGIVQEKKKKKIQFLSNLSELKIKGGPKDLSKNLDNYLYGR